jgi:hypothetical protein
MDPTSGERDWQNLLSGPVQHIGRLLSTPSVPGSCRLSFVCRAWRDAASTTTGQQIIYRSRVADHSSEQRDACFAKWIEKYAPTVSSLTLVWLDSPNAPVAALCKAAAAAAAASKPLPLQRLVWIDSCCLYEEVAALLPNLPHLRHLDISSCQRFTSGALASVDLGAPYIAALQALRSSRLRHLSMSLRSYHLLKPPSMKPQLEDVLSEWLADNASYLPTSLQSLQLDLEGLPVAFDASWLQHLVNLRHLALTGDTTPVIHSVYLDGQPLADPMLNGLLALPRLATVHISCGGLVTSSTSLAPVSHLIKELAVRHSSVLAGLGDYKALTGLDLDLTTVPQPLVTPPAPVRVNHLTITLQSHSRLKQGTTQVHQLQRPGTTTTSSSVSTSNLLGEVMSVGQLHSLCLYDLLPEAGPERRGIQGQIGPIKEATQLTALQLLLSNKAVQAQLGTWGPAVATLTALESLDAPLSLLDAPQLRRLPFLGLRRLVLRVVPEELTYDTLQELVVQLGPLRRLQRVRLEVMLDPWAEELAPAVAAFKGVVHSGWEACRVLERGMPHVAMEVCKVAEEQGVYSCPNQAIVRAGL